MGLQDRPEPSGRAVGSRDATQQKSERLEANSKVQFDWRAHPARDRIAASAAGLFVMMAVGVLVVAICRLDGMGPEVSIFWGLASMGFVLATVSRFYFPSRFAIHEEGIVAEYPLRTVRLRWNDVRRFAYDERGGILSRRARPTILDSFKGMPLIFDDASRDEAIREIRAHLPSNVRPIDARRPSGPRHEQESATGSISDQENRSWAG